MLSSLRGLESKIDRFLLAANGGRPILLYGAGFALPEIVRRLESYRFNIVGICDSNTEKHGTTHAGRYDIFSLADALDRFPEATFVISSPVYFEEIYRDLVEQVGPDRVSEVDLTCAYFFKVHEFRDFFANNRDRFESVLASLAEDASRDTLIKVIKAHLTGERKDFQEASTGNEDWYLFRSLLAPRSDTIYLDCGAYDGDTVRFFAESATEGYERICAFEPNENMRSSLASVAAKFPRIEVKEKGVAREVGTFSFRADGVFSALGGDDQPGRIVHIPVTTLDAELNGSRADIIKMDIEGAEYDALHGAESTIRRHKPKLAVCLYHKVEDLVRIPEFVASLVPEYKLYIRHQSESCTDTILFAVAD